MKINNIVANVKKINKILSAVFSALLHRRSVRSMCYHDCSADRYIKSANPSCLLAER